MFKHLGIECHVLHERQKYVLEELFIVCQCRFKNIDQCLNTCSVYYVSPQLFPMYMQVANKRWHKTVKRESKWEGLWDIFISVKIVTHRYWQVLCFLNLLPLAWKAKESLDLESSHLILRSLTRKPLITRILGQMVTKASSVKCSKCKARTWHFSLLRFSITCGL